MTKRSALSSISEFFNTFGSAVAVSSAIEARKTPRASDLRQLGIDPANFGNIRNR